MRRTKITKT